MIFDFWSVDSFGHKFIPFIHPLPTFNMSTGDYRVADISLADFGRKEIELAEHEVCIYTHLIIHTLLDNVTNIHELTFTFQIDCIYFSLLDAWLDSGSCRVWY